MNGVDFRVLEDVLVFLDAFLDSKIVADRVELLFVSLTDRVTVRLGMFLPDGYELGAKPETDDGDVKLFAHDISFVDLGGKDIRQPARSGGVRRRIQVSCFQIQNCYPIVAEKSCVAWPCSMRFQT